MGRCLFSASASVRASASIRASASARVSANVSATRSAWVARETPVATQIFRCPGLERPRTADGELVLFDANAPTIYVSRGDDFDSLVRVCDSPAHVSADLRTPESYENWEWLWATYREGPSWHALIHNEFHDTVAPTYKVGDPSPANPCWYNSITYAVSTDGAQSFVKPGAPAHVVASWPRVWVPPEPGTPPAFDGYYYLEG